MLSLTLLLVPMLFLSRFSFVITLLGEERELDYMFFCAFVCLSCSLLILHALVSTFFLQVSRTLN